MLFKNKLFYKHKKQKKQQIVKALVNSYFSRKKSFNNKKYLSKKSKQYNSLSITFQNKNNYLLYLN